MTVQVGKTRLSSLWYAQYSKSKGWSDIERIYTGTAIRWGMNRAGIKLDDKNNPHIAIIDNDILPEVGARVRPEIVYLKFGGTPNR